MSKNRNYSPVKTTLKKAATGLLLAILIFTVARTGGVYAQSDEEVYCSNKGYNNLHDCKLFLRKMGVYFYSPNYKKVTPQTSSCSVVSGSLANDATTQSRAQYVWEFLIKNGLTPVQAAGLMGNMQAESHFEPRLVEYGWKNTRGEISVPGKPSSLDELMPPPVGPNGEPGYGIIQWTSPGRKAGLKSLADKYGLTKQGDLGLQVDFLWQELTTAGKGGYADSTLVPLRAATTVEVATAIVANNYEIPGGDRTKAISIRTGFAHTILAQFGSDTGSGPNSVYTSASSNGCGVTATSHATAISAKALAYAWPDNAAGHDGLTPQPAYASAITPYPGIKGNDPAAFVGVVVHDSGADDGYRLTNTKDQEDYVRTAKKADGTAKFNIIPNATLAQLQPGDILIANGNAGGNTMIYVGNQNGYNAAGATATHMPNLSTLSSLTDPLGNGQFIVVRVN